MIDVFIIIIKVLGLIMAILGAAFVAVPRKLVKIMPFFKHGKRIYIMGVVRLVFAVIFLLSAWQCRWRWVIAIMGILTLIGGVLIFALKLKHIRAMLDWFSGKSDMILRITGVGVVIIGLLIILAA